MGALPDHQPLKMTHIVPDQVRARCPAREAQLQAPLGGHEAEFNVDKMLLRRPQIKAK
jgi:hypothetical protein